MSQHRFSQCFVEVIPTKMDDGVIYISMEYATAIHKCACGCGHEVVTALSPTDWSLLFDGETVSLEPSIGNWNFPCRSHYYIKKGIVRWAGDMSQEAINRGRARDRASKARYFQPIPKEPAPISPPALEIASEQMKRTPKPRGRWAAFMAWFGGR